MSTVPPSPSPLSNEPPNEPPVAPPDVVPPFRRGAGVGMAIAWSVIVLLVLGIVVGRSFMAQVADDADGGGGVMVDRLFEIQSKMLAGTVDRSTPEDRRLAFTQLVPFDGGSIRRRQQFVVMAWELAGIEEARSRLEAIDTLIEAGDAAPDVTDEDRAVQRVLENLYGSGDEPAVEALSDSDGSLLVERLEWFGRLALVPATGDSAARAEMLGPIRLVLVLLGVLALVGLLIGTAGLVGLVVMLTRAFRGRLRSGLITPGGAGGVYVESFAIWMVLFFGLQVAAAVIAAIVAPNASLLAAGVAFLVSLVVLAWPRLRGVSWARLRADAGLHTGRGGVREAGWGVACYAMSLPIIAFGVMITLVLMVIAGVVSGGELGAAPAPEDAPAHPIVTQIAEGGWFMVVQVYFVAAICAPIVEETFFRGLLYRHLREATGTWGTAGSIVLGTAANAFIFAVIHPQGLLAAPALMSIATGLTLAREWRGSLVAPIVMHGLNNTLAMTLLMVMLAA